MGWDGMIRGEGLTYLPITDVPRLRGAEIRENLQRRLVETVAGLEEDRWMYEEEGRVEVLE